MKIVHVCYCDKDGGAPIAAARLHKSLLAEGCDSILLVEVKKGSGTKVVGQSKMKALIATWWRDKIGRLPLQFYKTKTASPYTSTLFHSRFILDKLNEMNPDIVHLHWVSNHIMTFSDISRIKPPVLWSLHDMWAFTGGCHYDEECGLYQKRCGQCKVLNSLRHYDLSRWEWSKRINAYGRKKNIVLNGLSRWIADCASRATVANGLEVVNIPNAIDTDVYKPIDMVVARKIWNLPLDKKLILFGAMDATSDPRKGYEYLDQALKLLEYRNLELIVFGSDAPSKSSALPFKAHFMGQLKDDASLAVLYSACDVMVVPSIQENLSNAIIESLSCGTPVVAFDVGGNADMIQHLHHGYLAAPKSSEDLARGIDSILKNEKAMPLRENARSYVLCHFSNSIVAKLYMNQYSRMLHC